MERVKKVVNAISINLVEKVDKPILMKGNVFLMERKFGMGRI